MSGAASLPWWSAPFASKGAKAVALLMQQDPDGWVVDRYVASHKASRINVWIANEAYGIAVWTGRRDDFSHRAKPNYWDRRAIRRAFERRGWAEWQAAARAATARATGEQ